MPLLPARILFMFAMSIAWFPMHEAAAAVPVAPGKEILVIPLQGPIDKTLIYFMRRSFETARNERYAAVVIDMDTPGGRLDYTEEIIEWIGSLNKPVYAFVNLHAQSAGAIICLACDEIYMAPGSRIGSAVPIMLSPLGGVQGLPPEVKEKMLSDLRSMMRGLAQDNGYIPELAEGMVDPDIELAIGDRVIIKKGEIVNLTANDAIEIIPPRLEPLLATAQLESIDALLARKELAGLPRFRMERSGVEHLAAWLVAFAPLLIAGAIIGIFVEFKTPGFGLPGIIGFLSLAAFLFGHFQAGLTDKFDILLVVVGIVLIALELFVIPGFGVAGVLGILFLLSGLVMAMIPQLPGGPGSGTDMFGGDFAAPFLQRAALNLFLTFVICGFGIWMLSRLLPKTAAYSALVLKSATSVANGYIGANILENSRLLGCTGVAATDLRPAGAATIDGRRIDVVSEGDFIERGDLIRVKEVHGARVVVVLAPPEDTGDA